MLSFNGSVVGHGNGLFAIGEIDTSYRVFLLGAKYLNIHMCIICSVSKLCQPDALHVVNK